MSSSPIQEPRPLPMPIVIWPHPAPGPLQSALPLEHTTVRAVIRGLLARVTVTQRFSNPLEQPAELEYLFPLPENAAISAFVLQLGQRQITGEVEEREAARAGYEAALQQGKRAGLLEQRRSNLFAVRLANVQPGETLEAVVTYQQRIVMREEELEFVYPMGLTPRYDSPSHQGEGAGTHAPIARAGERIGPVEIAVVVDDALAGGEPASPSHALALHHSNSGEWEIQLREPSIPDHDFVLRLPTHASVASGAAWSAGKPGKETFLAALVPPHIDWGEQGASIDNAPPREFLFVLDRSGSMAGEPILQARNALRACLRALGARDTFRILLFDDRLEWFDPAALPISQAAIDRADSFLDAVQGRGGTEITGALQAALSQPAVPARQRYVVFLTDGAVSAEERTLDLLRKSIGAARLFTFGVGPSVNRGLLNRMAVQGRGQSFFLQLDEDIEGAIIRFQDRVSFPMLTDLSLEWENAKAWDVYPSLLPDLYAGEPLEFTGRLARKDGPAAVIVRGKRAGLPVELRLAFPDPVAEDSALARAWARARIDDLLDEAQLYPQRAEKIRAEVIGLALEHDLVTPYTAFVAIDRETSSTGKPTKIQVAQPLPQGLQLEGFVGGAQPAMLRMMSSPAMGRPAAGRKQTFAARMVQDNTSALAGPPLYHQSIQDAPQPVSLPGHEGLLRSLARTQRADGSWEGDVERTAAALLAFAAAGHTTRSGSFRQALRRAAVWLAVNQGQGWEVYLRARALAVIEARTPAGEKLELAKFGLPEPVTELERAAFGDPVTPPAAIQTLDDLRLAALLHAPLPVPENLLRGTGGDLAQIWAAVLPAVSG